MEQDSYEKKV